MLELLNRINVIPKGVISAKILKERKISFSYIGLLQEEKIG